MIRRIAARIQALAGWRRLGFAFVLGATATLALAPLHFIPALVLSFSGLIWLFDGAARKRTAFAVGWWFGFGYFAAGLYWVGFAMLVDAARYALLMPFASLGLPAGLAIFSGLAGLAYFCLKPATVSRVIVLALVWTAAEWLRSTILTGFPWNLVGYSWMGSEAVAQSGAFIGIHGLGLITVMAAASAASISDDGPARSRFGPAGIALIGLGVVWSLGAWRIATTQIEDVESVRLRLVQANVPQYEKWRPEFRRKNLELHLDLSASPGADQISHFIWPETATPFLVGQDPNLRKTLTRIIDGKGLLITGAPRTTAARETPRRYWNSLLALDSRGDVVATYDKFHLVPFGEYIPLRGLLDVVGLGGLVAGRGDFQRGDGPQTLDLAGLPPVSPLICYEAIFPGEVRNAGAQPDWMLNLTTDAWFGMTAGPYQHLAMTRMRAIEEGMAMVRAANTGISAVIDPLGRVRHKLGLGVSGVVDATLPKPLISRTLYARVGDWPALGLFLAGFGLVGWLRRRTR